MTELIRALATISTRVHYRLAGTPVGPIYVASLAKIQRLQGDASYLTWRATRSRPRLNRDSVLQYIPSTINAENGIIPGRLLARIAFHFRRPRLKYLVEVTQQLRFLPFSEVVIAIDTNSPDALNIIRKLCAPHEIKVHDNLKQPRFLAWTHRKAMKSAFSNFDYFLYVEDDMLLTPSAVRIWHERLPSLTKYGYLPSFLKSSRTVRVNWWHQISATPILAATS